MSTKFFDMRIKGQNACLWNEEFIVNEYASYICQPHELEIWEDSFHNSNKEVHCVNVDVRVLFDVAMLNLNGHDFTGGLELCFVHLSKAGHAERPFFEIRENLQRLKIERKLKMFQ